MKYTKLVFEGSSDTLRAFLAGWSAGRDMQPDELRRRVLWPDDWDIKDDGALKDIVDAITHRSDFTVLLAEDIVDPVLKALEPWQRRLAVELETRRDVRAAYFEFEFEIFARDQAADVRSIFESLPDGVDVSDDYQPAERSDPGAAGTEMYAPAHEYEFRGKGTIGGDLRGVLEVRERAKRHERIKTTHVELRLEP